MDLLEWSRALYPAWVASLASSHAVEFQRSGLLVLQPFDLAAARPWAQRYGQALSEVVAKDIEPSTMAGSALWLPEVAQVRNPRLLQALRYAMQAQGVRIKEHSPVTDWAVSGGKVTGAITQNGTIAADYFVVAAGAWSGEVLTDKRAALRIKPMRGQILLYKDRPGRLQRILYKEGYYIIPRLDGHILVGSTLEDAGFDKSTSAEARALLAARGADMLPWLAKASVVGHWAGLRPAAADNIPVIAPHPELKNLFINSGHYRYGVTMAPASARLVADLILGRAPSLDPTPYAWPV